MSEHEQVPALFENLEPAVGNQHLEEFAIGERDDVVILAHHDQHWLLEEWQRRNAGPAHHREQLIDVAARGGRGEAADMLALASGQSAVKRLEMLLHKGRVDVAARVGHFGQCGGITRQHHHPCGGRGEDQAAHVLAVLDSEMLRHRATPRYPHHIDHARIEAFEQFLGDPAHREGVVRHRRFGRAAHTGHVEHDEAPLGQRFGQGRDRLDIGADAIEKQDWRMVADHAPAPPRHAQGPSADYFHREFGGQFVFHQVRSFKPALARIDPERLRVADISCCPPLWAQRPACPNAAAPNPSTTATSFRVLPRSP